MKGSALRLIFLALVGAWVSLGWSALSFAQTSSGRIVFINAEDWAGQDHFRNLGRQLLDVCGGCSATVELPRRKWNPLKREDARHYVGWLRIRFGNGRIFEMTPNQLERNAVIDVERRARPPRLSLELPTLLGVLFNEFRNAAGSKSLSPNDVDAEITKYRAAFATALIKKSDPSFVDVINTKIKGLETLQAMRPRGIMPIRFDEYVPVSKATADSD